MKKEKHPVYRLILICFFVLLALGAALLALGLTVGGEWRFMNSPAQHI